MNGASSSSVSRKREVAVIAGFQGIHKETGRITTLGRGGSDTSAVAVAAAIHADRCDIYTDVDGVYTTDPRIVPKARRLEKVAYEEMLEMASLGAKVLQVRSVELAMQQKVRVNVRSSFDPPDAPHATPTAIRSAADLRRGGILENQVVTVRLSKDEAQIDPPRRRPAGSPPPCSNRSPRQHHVDMTCRNSADGRPTLLHVPVTDLERAKQVRRRSRRRWAFRRSRGRRRGEVSIIGVGMRTHAGVAATAFKALAERQINIRAISTSEIKISVLIDAAYTELAVRTLHSVYGLDQ